MAGALAAAKAISDERRRAEALRSLAPYISQIHCVALITLPAEITGRLSRSDALLVIFESIHISAALGSVETLEDIRRAISDTARWYP
jgi:hypothetical protein